MPAVGEEYDGRVKNIQAYGAFVEIAQEKMVYYTFRNRPQTNQQC